MDISQKSVPFLDLKKINQTYQKEIETALLGAVRSGWYILGDSVKSFEQQFSYYCGVKHCIGVGNGLDALVLILQGYIELGRINVGDEVIVPSNTYIATVLSVSHTQLKPILVEPDNKTYNIDPKLIEEHITERTRAIMPVHLYGQCADMQPVMRLAEKYDLIVIEDAAQAHGAKHHDSITGNLAHAAGFSFYPGKNLGALGDGGAITTNNDQLADIVRTLRNYGSQKKYYNSYKGYNSRLDELHATTLSVKLKYLDRDNATRRRIAERYLTEIRNPKVILPHILEYNSSVWHLFVVRTQERDNLQQFLADVGIQTSIHYPVPPHKQEAYSELSALSLPVAESIHREVLSLPIGPTMEKWEIKRVIDAVNAY